MFHWCRVTQPLLDRQIHAKSRYRSNRLDGLLLATSNPGSAGPSARRTRSASLNSFLVVSSDYSVHDFGDLSFSHLEKDEPYMDVNFPRSVGGANKMLSGAVSRAVGAGHTLVMLGGDHRWLSQRMKHTRRQNVLKVLPWSSSQMYKAAGYRVIYKSAALLS